MVPINLDFPTVGDLDDCWVNMTNVFTIFHVNLKNYSQILGFVKNAKTVLL